MSCLFSYVSFLIASSKGSDWRDSPEEVHSLSESVGGDPMGKCFLLDTVKKVF